MNPSIENSNTDTQRHPSTPQGGEGTGVRFLITGAAGFIGSCMASFLNEKGFENLLLCDDFGVEGKRKNWESKQYEALIERYNLFEWLEANESKIDFVFHLGARTDTTEFDYAVHQELNVDFTQNLWNWCTKHQVPLVYASSAATYGAGELGYEDNENIISQLQPLNPYGVSKNEIDKWILQQVTPSASPTPPKEGLKNRDDSISQIENQHTSSPNNEVTQPNLSPSFGGVGEAPPFWAGLKFFNVYGPNEAHKGRMASVIWHSFNQIKKNGEVKLFRSHRPDFKDGQQLRDFVYVKDVVKVMYWLFQSTVGSQQLAEEQSGAELEIESAIAESQVLDDRQQTTDQSDWRNAINENWNEEEESVSNSNSPFIIRHSPIPSAIYNLGTGTARSFYDLASATFRGLDMEPNIVFINMPEDIRDKYQYFTEADMHKLKNAGYSEPFYTLEEGVDDYVRNYLAKGMMC